MIVFWLCLCDLPSAIVFVFIIWIWRSREDLVAFEKRGRTLLKARAYLQCQITHTHIHRPLDFHLQRYRDARQHSWRSPSWARAPQTERFLHAYNTHTHTETRTAHLLSAYLNYSWRKQDKKLQMRLCRPALKHMDFSQQEDDALLNLCHCIHFEIKWIEKVLCTK